MAFDINTIADIVRPYHDKIIAEGKAAILERENARLRAALQEIANGLADTGSTPGQRMTLIPKARACEIARTALRKGPA